MTAPRVFYPGDRVWVKEHTVFTRQGPNGLSHPRLVPRAPATVVKFIAYSPKRYGFALYMVRSADRTLHTHRAETLEPRDR